MVSGTMTINCMHALNKGIEKHVDFNLFNFCVHPEVISAKLTASKSVLRQLVVKSLQCLNIMSLKPPKRVILLL